MRCVGVVSTTFRWTFAALLLAWPPSPALAAGGTLTICAEHAGADDWQDEWARGPVIIPAGAVFDQAGHILGTLQDPKDYAHSAGATGWKVSPSENERRSKLLLEDAAADKKHGSGVVTTRQVRLTKVKPCADAPAAAVLSPEWGWTVAPVFGDTTRYYQLYGVISGGKLNTGFNDDESPLDHLAARGQLNAVVNGTLTETVRLGADAD